MSTPFRLLIPRDLYDAMIAQAFAELPNECCGLFAGRVGQSQRSGEVGGNDVPVVKVVCRYALVNVMASPREYLSNDQSLIKAHCDMREKGTDVAAIYHSHPIAPPVPSKKDMVRNFYGLYAMHFIVSLERGTAEVRAWWLGENDYLEATWEVIEPDAGGQDS